jgi:hypothetical protein
MNEFKIQIPEGHEIDLEKSDLGQGIVTFKKAVSKLPMSWDGIHDLSGYFVSNLSGIRHHPVSNPVFQSANRNVFPSKEEAEACLALAQLCQLRDRWNKGWKPDWIYPKVKFMIRACLNELEVVRSQDVKRVMAFKNKKLAREFLLTFKELLETAKPLL